MSELFESLSATILEGKAEKAHKLVEEGLKQGLSPKEILDNGLIVGMNEVGARFKRGDMFVPEVLMSANTMAAGMETLRPLLVQGGEKKLGKILMGTVKGDLHDIGKNLVSMLCEGAGFEIINLGFNVEPDTFIKAIKEHQPDIVGMSAMLTTTMRTMDQTIKAIEDAGLRDKVKIMVGGALVDGDFADAIGADGYASNAASAVDLAKQLIDAA